MPVLVRHADGVAGAVGEEVHAHCLTDFSYLGVHAYESAEVRVVVSRLEVIEPGLVVMEVSAEHEVVELRDLLSRRRIVGADLGDAPVVVVVGDIGVALRVDDGGDVAHEVPLVEVLLVAVGEADELAGLVVVEEDDLFVAALDPLHGRDPASLDRIELVEAAGALCRADSVGVVTSNTILSILQNEKYKGDALLQKRFVVDFLEHKTKKNEGEVTQYYVKDSHPAIIPKEDWELVQIEITRRKKLRYNYSKKNPFFGKLVCEDCDGYYGRKVWHSNDAKRKKEVLQCNDKFKRKCRTPTLDEDEAKAMFLKAYNSMFVNKEKTVSDIEFVKDRLTDTSDIDIKISKLNAELEKLVKDIETLVKENTRTVKDQEIWKKKYAELEDSYKNKVSSLDELTLKKKEKILKGNRIDAFIELIRKGEILAEFDERIFNFVLDRAVVHHDASITFIFLYGEEITIKAGKE